MKRISAIVLVFMSVVSGALTLTGGDAQAFLCGSLCPGPNTPLLAELAGSGVISSVPTAAITTGSTATAVTTVTGGATSVAGVSFLSEALGGAAGLLLLGAGVLGYELFIDGDVDLPEGVSGTDSIFVAGDGEVWESSIFTRLDNGLRIEINRLASPTSQYCATVLADGYYGPGMGLGSGGASSAAYQVVDMVGYGASPSNPVVAVRCAVSYLNPWLVPGQNMSPGTIGGPLDGGHLSSASIVVHDFTFQTVPFTVINPGSAAPERWLEDTITCKNAAGEIATITGGGPHSTTNITSLGLACPDGDRLLKHESKLKTDGGEDLDLGTTTVPPELEQIPQNCFNSGVTCELELEHRLSNGWQLCTYGGGCPELWSDVLNEPQDFRCRMNSGIAVPVPLDWCSVLFPDPLNVEQTVPIPVAEPGGNPLQDPSNCDFGWGNLLDGTIIHLAFLCALEKAFIPSEGFMESQGQDVTVAWDASGPGAWTASMSSVADLWTVTNDGDCHGPQWAIPVGSTQESVPLDILSICDEPQATMSMWTRLVSTVAISLLGGIAIVRWVLRGFGIGTPVIPDQQLELSL